MTYGRPQKIEEQPAPPVVSPPTTPAPTPATVTPSSAFRTLGNTTLEATTAALSRSFNSSPSPMAREAEAIWKEATAKGLGRLAVAMAWHETKNHTWNCTTAPQPCVPLAAKNPYAMTGRGPLGQVGRWAVYSSYAEATRAWCERLLDPAGPYRSATSIADLIAVYSPAFDGNDEALYARVVCREINDLPLLGVDPAPAPAQRDPFDVIMGATPYTDDYGFLDDVGLAYYQYGVGHGTTRPTQHTGVDLCAPYGSRIHSPIAGTVVCRGNEGTPMWGMRCGAYQDFGNGSSGPVYGVGNLTIMSASGNTRLTLGHMREVAVRLGDRVAPGQYVGTMGGMNGAHIHVETSIQRNGSFWLVDPREQLRKEMGGQQPAPADNPFRKPAVFDLVDDAARYGLSPAQARKIRNNCFPGRRGHRVQAIFWHVMQGSTKGSLSWWSDGPGVQASSSVMVNRDGSLIRVVFDADAPWTNGQVARPTGKGRLLLDRIGNVNPNLVSVTLEAEGMSGDKMGEAQLETVCWMTWEWMRRYGLKLDDIYRHSDIDSVNRGHCPGRYHDAAMAMLREAGGR